MHACMHARTHARTQHPTHTHFKRCYYVPPTPHQMGKHIVFSSVVCPSVCLSVNNSFVSTMSFEPMVGFTNNFAQITSMMRQCTVPICLTKVGATSRSQSKIKHV